MCTSCKVQINGKGGQFSVAEGGQFYIAANIRGWQLGDGVYFGQAKVGKKWGVGVIVDRGQYVYGINNRGIQLLRRL
jgi:hypothetical protein